MCQKKLYPPRFSVLVRGPVRPDDVVRADFTFPGAEVIPGRGEPVAVVNLPLKAQQQYLSTGSFVLPQYKVPFACPSHS